MSGTQVLDVEKLMKQVGSDPTLLSDLVNLFQDYSPELMACIKDAIDQGDSSALRETAHQFKGAIGNFYAEAAVQTAKELEDAGKNNRLENAPELFDRLETNVQKMTDMLSELCDQ